MSSNSGPCTSYLETSFSVTPRPAPAATVAPAGPSPLPGGALLCRSVSAPRVPRACVTSFCALGVCVVGVLRGVDEGLYWLMPHPLALTLFRRRFHGNFEPRLSYAMDPGQTTLSVPFDLLRETY